MHGVRDDGRNLELAAAEETAARQHTDHGHTSVHPGSGSVHMSQMAGRGRERFAGEPESSLIAAGPSHRRADAPMDRSNSGTPRPSPSDPPVASSRGAVGFASGVAEAAAGSELNAPDGGQLPLQFHAVHHGHRSLSSSHSARHASPPNAEHLQALQIGSHVSGPGVIQAPSQPLLQSGFPTAVHPTQLAGHDGDTGQLLLSMHSAQVSHALQQPRFDPSAAPDATLAGSLPSHPHSALSSPSPPAALFPDDNRTFHRHHASFGRASSRHADAAADPPPERALMHSNTWPRARDQAPAGFSTGSPFPDQARAPEPGAADMLAVPGPRGRAKSGAPSPILSPGGGPGPSPLAPSSVPPPQPVGSFYGAVPYHRSTSMHMHGDTMQRPLDTAATAVHLLPMHAMHVHGTEVLPHEQLPDDQYVHDGHTFTSPGEHDVFPPSSAGPGGSVGEAGGHMGPHFAQAFLQTIHEGDASAAGAPTERKLHNQASQCSTATSFGSRRFLQRNVSSFSNSSVADSFRSRNSSMRSYNSSFRSIGGASSFADFRLESFKEGPEGSEDMAEPLRAALQPGGLLPTSDSAAAVPDSAAVAAVAAQRAAAADPAVNAAAAAANAAAAAAGLQPLAGEPPPYLSREVVQGGALEHRERRLATDMTSLARQLDQASSALPAVIQALSDTAPTFSLGLPALTKLLCNSSKRGRHAKALAIFHAAPALALAPDLPLCNAALMAASSAGNAAATSAIFDGMTAVGIQPDSVTYRAAATALAKQGRVQRALQVLLHMLRTGRVYDSTAFMAGVLAAGRRQAWAVGEMMLIAAFKHRFKVTRLSSLTPPPVSAVPEAFREIYLQLCKLNGVQPVETESPPPDASTSDAQQEESAPATQDDSALQPNVAKHTPEGTSTGAHSPADFASAPRGSTLEPTAPETSSKEPAALPEDDSAPVERSPAAVATGDAAPMHMHGAPDAALGGQRSVSSGQSSQHLGRYLLPSVALTSSGDVDDTIMVEVGSRGFAAGSSRGTLGGRSVADAAGSMGSVASSVRKPQRQLSNRHSAPLDSLSVGRLVSPSPDPAAVAPTGGIGHAAGVVGGVGVGESSAQRNIRRVVSADERPLAGQSQKRYWTDSSGAGGQNVQGAPRSMGLAAAAAIAAVSEEEILGASKQDASDSRNGGDAVHAVGTQDTPGSPPRKRHLSPGESAGSGASWGASGGSEGGRTHLSVGAGSGPGSAVHGSGHSQQEHSQDILMGKRVSSSSGDGVAKLALALADARLSLTSDNSLSARENSVGPPTPLAPGTLSPTPSGMPASTEHDSYVTSLLGGPGPGTPPPQSPQDVAAATAAAFGGMRGGALLPGVPGDMIPPPQQSGQLLGAIGAPVGLDHLGGGAALGVPGGAFARAPHGSDVEGLLPQRFAPHNRDPSGVFAAHKQHRPATDPAAVMPVMPPFGASEGGVVGGGVVGAGGRAVGGLGAPVGAASQVAGGAAGKAGAGQVQDESASTQGPDAADPLLRACFNAQLLAYSSDPALLDRSTEILMIMLESGGEISPDVLSFNIILRTVCSAQHLQVAPALLEMMGIARVVPLVSTYAIYMAGAASAGDAWLVVHAWQTMLSMHIVPDITCIMFYLAALFQLGECVEAATLFLRIASPPVFLAPDPSIIAVMFAIWMHHQITTAAGSALGATGNPGGHSHGAQRMPAGGQENFSMTSMICRAAAAHMDSALEATQILLEEVARAGCIHAMHAVTTAQQQYLASTTRLPVAQGVAGMLATMLQGGVGECAGICVGGVVRRATDSILRLGGAPVGGDGSDKMTQGAP